MLVFVLFISGLVFCAQECFRNVVVFPTHEEVRAALVNVVNEGISNFSPNGGFNLQMWSTIVDRDGVIQSIVFSGAERGDQWPGSRIISAQKAYTANAFSLPNFALSTANLYTAVQPGGSLYGLQHSNPIDATVAYSGPNEFYGTTHDPLKYKKIGGINVFGGGLPLYARDGTIIGAIGVSGDTSCADHAIAWKLRHALGLDHVPAGPNPITGDDNIIYDIVNGLSGSGWGHPLCGDVQVLGAVLSNLPQVRKIEF